MNEEILYSLPEFTTLLRTNYGLVIKEATLRAWLRNDGEILKYFRKVGKSWIVKLENKNEIEILVNKLRVIKKNKANNRSRRVY